MFRRFKNIKIKWLIVHLIITLAYPAARGITAPRNGLQMFTDAMTVIGALLIVLGVFYTFYLKGDFDRSAYIFKRGFERGIVKPYEAYVQDNQEKREESFNYPLFLGVIYIAASVVIAYGFL